MASSSFGMKSLYNSATFSDVVIKFSDREIKCHRAVLFRGSEYFANLVGQDSQFAERNQPIIELHEDDPDAVEMMLRHFYNFPYDIYKKEAHGRDDIEFHMQVYVTAKKYLVEALRLAALNAIRNTVDVINGVARRSGLSRDTPKLLEIITILNLHGGENEYFGQRSKALTKEHLGYLITISDFRKTLEKGENKEVLDSVIKAVQAVHKNPHVLNVGGEVVRRNPDLLGVGGGESEHTKCLTKCLHCGYSWLTQWGPTCKSCGTHDAARREVTRWRRI